MGCVFSDEPTMPVELKPQSAPFAAIEKRFALPQQTTLQLSEKVYSFSNDDFQVCNAHTGQPCFKIDGRAFSLRQKKTLYDTQNLPVANMKRETLAFFPNHHVFRGNNSTVQLLTIRAKASLFQTELAVVVRNLFDGQPCEIGCHGSWRARNALIWLDRGRRGVANQQAVATVKRSVLTVRNVVFDKQDYFVSVAPGVDTALIVLICIALDEAAKDD